MIKKTGLADFDYFKMNIEYACQVSHTMQIFETAFGKQNYLSKIAMDFFANTIRTVHKGLLETDQVLSN